MKTKIKILLLLFVFIGLVSFKSSQKENSSTREPGMFKVTIFYPGGDGKTFDMDYYETKHMPMVAEFIGKNLRFYEIDKGISGRTSADTAPFMAIGYFYITDVAQYDKAIGKNRDAIINDFKNYTNIIPVIQISEIKHLGRDNKK